MDLYESVDSNGNLTGQVHDFNPGIRPSGLFWIQPVSEDTLDADLEDGEATVSVDGLAERDYHTLSGSLSTPPGPFVPASVSFDMRWKSAGPSFSVSRADQGFRGKFRLSNMELDWSARVGNFAFKSDSGANVKSVIGQERNGIFF